MSKKILVTGGAGFIGSHLTDHLLALGHSVRVLDNLRNGSRENLKLASLNPKFEFLHGDITNIQDCNRALDGIEIVYHLACLGVRHSLHSPLENQLVNAHGTLLMLKASSEAKVKRFFYISTSEIYGKVDQFPISETALPKPTTVYGSSKLAGEHYALSYQDSHGLDVTVIRIFNNFGPRSHYAGDSGELLPRSIVRILNREPPVIFGDGLVTRDFLFVKDTARALALLLQFPEVSGHTFNLGTGTEITIRNLINQLIQAMGVKVEILYHEARPADVPRLWVNAKKFHQVTGFCPQTSFEQGLADTIVYFQDLFKQGSLAAIPLENWKER